MYLLIYFWLFWVFVAVCRLFFLVATSGGCSWVIVCGLLTAVTSVVAEHRRQGAGFSHHGTWAGLLHSTWHLPRPGIKPVYPALAGEFFITEPPGKLDGWVLYKLLIVSFQDGSQRPQISENQASYVRVWTINIWLLERPERKNLLFLPGDWYIQGMLILLV